ncbi:MAG: class I SAM-dependent methyltransferase [Alphaproteobacteria bacterium]
MADDALVEIVGPVRGSEALVRLLRETDVEVVLDIGSGAGEQAAVMRRCDVAVTTVDIAGPADHIGDFMLWAGGPRDFDAVWCCHVLEHQPNPGAFLSACRRRLRPGGLLAVTVPPLKHEIVGGHVTLWNAGLLVYQLILAGFDCRAARVGTYASGPGYPPYNVSVLVRRPIEPLVLPPLRMDTGDIETLAPFFPIPVRHGFDGRLPDIRW